MKEDKSHSFGKTHGLRKLLKGPFCTTHPFIIIVLVKRRVDRRGSIKERFYHHVKQQIRLC